MSIIGPVCIWGERVPLNIQKYPSLYDVVLLCTAVIQHWVSIASFVVPLSIKSGLDWIFLFSVRLTLQWNNHKVWGFRMSSVRSQIVILSKEDLFSGYNCTGLTPPWPRRRIILFFRDMLQPRVCIFCGGFILQQDDESKHNSKLCKNYLKTKADQGGHSHLTTYLTEHLWSHMKTEHSVTPHEALFNTVKSCWDNMSQ